MSTPKHLNVLPLGSYSMLLGMVLLCLHRNKLYCYDKAIETLDDSGEPRVLQGKKKATSIRMVTIAQENHSQRKGCVLFAVHISSDKGKEVEDAYVLSKYPILQ